MRLAMMAYVHIYIYMFIHIHIFISAYIYIHIYIYIHVYIHIIYIYIHTYIYICIICVYIRKKKHIYIYIHTLVAMLSRPYPEVVIRCHQPPAQHLREPRTTFHYRWWASCFSTSRMYRGDCGFLGPQRRHSYKINPGSTWTNSSFPVWKSTSLNFW